MILSLKLTNTEDYVLEKNDDKPFGNVSLIVFPPMRETHIFDSKSPASRLWKNIFRNVVILKQNFRQKGDPRYYSRLQHWLSGQLS